MSEDKGSQITPATEIEESNTENQIKQLQNQLKACTLERDEFKAKLQQNADELAALRAQGESGGQDALGRLRKDNAELRAALAKAAELLKEKENVCTEQDKRNKALQTQIASLKEVVAITKDLLNIRNMEVQHLQKDVDGMEERIKAEKERHSAIISKMEIASKLNNELKKEYENQLALFQSLKKRYEQKVAILTKENVKLRDGAVGEEDFVDAHEELGSIQ